MSQRRIEIPGEVTSGTIAEAFGIEISDEDRAAYQEILDAIQEAERKAHKILQTGMGKGILQFPELPRNNLAA